MFKFFVLVAFLIRLVLMPLSAHSDLFFINIFPNLLISEKVFNITTFVQENFKDRNYTYYSPLTYYTFGFFQWIYHFISPGFSSWMSELYVLEYNGFVAQAADFIIAANNPHIYKDLFLAKIPYLLFDIASIVVLFKFIKDKFLKKTAILLWLFNPINLYATYIMGQFDIIPTFFVLSGFYFLKKNLNLAMLLLGIAAAYKNFALLLIIPVVIIYGDSTLKRMKLFALGIAPYLLFLVPAFISDFQQSIYMLFPKAYLHYRKPLEDWPLYSQILKYILVLVSYAFVIFLSAFLKVKDRWTFSVQLSLCVLLLIYAIAPRISFHYLLWAAPLIVLTLKNIKISTMVIIIQALSLSSYKLLANHLQLGLFAPLNPEYFSKLPTLNYVINQIFPYSFISALGFFIFMIVNLSLTTAIIGHIIFQMPTKLINEVK